MDNDWTARVNAEYEKSPALAPFSRTPMPPDLAAELGTRSYAEAQTRARQQEATA